MKGRQVSGIDASLVFPLARKYKASACRRRFHFQVTSGTEEAGASGGNTESWGAQLRLAQRSKDMYLSHRSRTKLVETGTVVSLWGKEKRKDIKSYE